MKLNTLSRFLLHCCTLALCLAASHTTHAGLVISNISFGDFSSENPDIASSLTFNLVGTIDDVVGTSGKNILVIAEKATEQGPNTSWILKYAGGTWTSDPTMSLPENVTVFTEAIGGGVEGDRAFITLGGGNQTTPTFTYQQFISGTFFIEGGEFDTSATDTSQWVVAAGWNDFLFPDPSTLTGSAVPEPTSFAVLLVGMLAVSRRRR